jgi:hypothetical protein
MKFALLYSPALPPNPNIRLPKELKEMHPFFKTQTSSAHFAIHLKWRLLLAVSPYALSSNKPNGGKLARVPAN